MGKTELLKTELLVVTHTGYLWQMCSQWYIDSVIFGFKIGRFLFQTSTTVRVLARKKLKRVGGFEIKA